MSIGENLNTITVDFKPFEIKTTNDILRKQNDKKGDCENQFITSPFLTSSFSPHSASFKTGILQLFCAFTVSTDLQTTAQKFHPFADV